jgi:16S rRNA C1402 N4-methylase RsmH
VIPLVDIAQERVRTVLRPGDIAVDATVGNGFDTLFLAKCVGQEGKVYGLDIQSEALDATRDRLNAAGRDNVVLFERSHADLYTVLSEIPVRNVQAVMFNLGYRPGGDKRVITQTESTILAIEGALKLLSPGGIISIIAYVGHSGGNDEAEAVEALLNCLDREQFQMHEEQAAQGRVAAPRLFLVSRHAN